MSRVERAKQSVADSDILAYAERTGASDEVAAELRQELREIRLEEASWSRQLRAGHYARQEYSQPIERNAQDIQLFEVAVVPRLGTDGRVREVRVHDRRDAAWFAAGHRGCGARSYRTARQDARFDRARISGSNPSRPFEMILRMNDWLGNLPSWVSAIAASCALIFTSWTAFNSQRSARASEKQARVALDQQHQRNEKDWQEQASKVAAWIGASEKGGGQSIIYVRWVNSSEVPAYTMEITPVSHPRYRYLVPVVEPTSQVRSVKFEALTERIQSEALEASNAAAQTRLSSTLDRLVGVHSTKKILEVQQAGATVRFRDTNNAVWCRLPDGKLKRETEQFDPFSFEISDPGDTIDHSSGVIEVAESD